MNLLGILSLLLISSSSVLCRRIRRQDLEIPPENELANLSKLRDEISERNQNSEVKSWKADGATPADDDLEENLAVPDETETEGIHLPEYEIKFETPVSKKRIQKMLHKAIIKIITGELTTADMLLLKSLNYDAEQVRTIRERELKKLGNQQETITEERKPDNRMDIDSEKIHQQKKTDYDYEAYNNQATLDYEYAASNYEANNESWTDSQTEYEPRKDIGAGTFLENGGSLGANVVFTIKYNDSEFDSSSEENPKVSSTEDNLQTAINGTGNTFPAVTTAANSTPAPVDDRINNFSELWNVKNYFSTTEDPEEDNDVSSQNKEDEDSDQLNPESRFRYNVDEPLVAEESRPKVSLSVSALPSNTENLNATSNSTTSQNGTSSTKYKGLKWIQDNVYQVLPEYFDMPIDTDNDTSESSYENASYQNLDELVEKDPITPNDLVDTDGMANDAPDPSGSWMPAENVAANVTAQRLMATHQREAQKQKTEDDIKSRVLMITGRLNSTINNPLQPRQEKLAMFTPTCVTPRNTDSESWQDSLSMNMHFQLNLSSDQHLVAARLRLFRLPQDNTTATASTVVDGAENDEKKIRVSVYYYTKSLKKHRSKKCLMDSKVASLTNVGEHFALDVKDAVKRWRSTTRNSNHGLLVLVEDQEGHPLRPSHYIQAPNCHTPMESVQQDEKAYQRVPTLFVRACRRYVRIVGNREITHEICG